MLDGGAARIGLPSTVVRIAAGGLEVLREGAIRAEALAAVLGECGRL